MTVADVHLRYDFNGIIRFQSLAFIIQSQYKYCITYYALWVGLKGANWEGELRV